MKFKPRMGLPIMLAILSFGFYLAYQGSSKVANMDVKTLALVIGIGSVIWLLAEILTSMGGKSQVTDRTVTDDGTGRPLETTHEREVR